MPSFGRLRCASTNSRPTISVVAPAPAKIGPVASALLLGPAPDSSSRPIISQTGGWRSAASFSASPVSAAPDYGTAQQSTAAAGRSAWRRSPAGLYNRRRRGSAESASSPVTSLPDPISSSNWRPRQTNSNTHRDGTLAGGAQLLSRGTEGSNPAPSTGEAAANLVPRSAAGA
jgi:hypothetical protein